MIIGISGKAGSGKDTLGSYLLEMLPGFERRKFADKLKAVAALMTGVGDQHSALGKAQFMDSWGMTVGEFQQRLGTDAVRNHLHPDAWVFAAFADFQPDSRWIFTDVRFPNEADAIRKLGGWLFRVERCSTTQLCGRNSRHESETALDGYTGFNLTYHNDGTLDDLAVFARHVAASVKANEVGIMASPPKV